MLLELWENNNLKICQEKNVSWRYIEGVTIQV